MRARALIGATLASWALLPALALVASADEDPPLRPPDAGPPLRPPLTVLRAAATAPPAPTLSVVAPGGGTSPRKELIVLVGGLGTDDRPDKNPFAALQARLPGGAYDVLRFGTNIGVYDTYAPIEDNARRLRDSVRSVSGGYDAVHIVTHSLGGVVADQAFALGLSSSDGVTTYVAWSAPHDGAHGARLATTALSLSGPARRRHARCRDVARYSRSRHRGGARSRERTRRRTAAGCGAPRSATRDRRRRARD